jgi:hypothetical protein
VNTFFWYWELAALYNLDGCLGLVSWVLGDVLDRLDDFVALEDFAEYNVFAVEVAGKVSRCRSKWGEGAYPGVDVVMKNCEPLVSFPALAMERRPFLECFNLKFSSGNLAP